MRKTTGKFRFVSFLYAFQGVKEVLRTQPNMRVHLFFASLAISAGFYFEISAGEWCAVWLCTGLVMGFEAINTAIENIVDLVSPEYHPLAGKAKDAAAAAVLLAAAAAFITGLIIFLPKVC